MICTASGGSRRNTVLEAEHLIWGPNFAPTSRVASARHLAETGFPICFLSSLPKFIGEMH